MKDRSKKATPETPGADFKLTDNQRWILLRLFAGMVKDEVAAEKGCTPSTVFNTVLRVRNDLGLRTDLDLMRELLRRGIVTLDEIYALADTIGAIAEDQPRDERG